MLRHLTARALCVLLLGSSAATDAETLGDARQLSHVGEALRLRIPVVLDTAPPLDTNCLGIVAPSSPDGVPHLLSARIALERARGALTIETDAVMREPVVRLLVRTHCSGEVRAYTLLLEPPGSSRLVQVPPQAMRVDAANGRASSSEAAAAASVTVIPVRPSGALKPTQPAASAVAPANGASMSRETTAPSPPSTDAATASPGQLEAENETLKRRLDELNAEVDRLQRANNDAKGAGSAQAAAPRNQAQSAAALPLPPDMLAGRWDVGLSLAIGLGGLAAVVIAFVWQRRRGGDWPLTGPPSHRVVSRTSLAEDPVPFKPSGPPLPERPPRAEPPQVERRRQAIARASASVLLQPSADDLARELEAELEAAERGHSSLERLYPDLVEALARAWGTASARAQLASILNETSPDTSEMPADVVAELQLLQRIAEDLAQRPGPKPPPTALGPITPAS